ncbi:MAG: RnfABCDGE type electron transport complex subunit B [Oscillospiraceae bacterium]|nr:RnfABCDGE type electron transport complex subunit B [Oscillospiraceae bacterium]
MSNILSAFLVLSIMGAVFGLILAIASKVFAVKTDDRLEPIMEALPGANCGGCGFAGCGAYAQAILDGKAEIGRCAAGGNESAKKIAAIMGVEAVELERQVALVRCRGYDRQSKGPYDGIEDCLAASKVAGRGPISCKFGCLGYGNCVKACQFGAISIRDGTAFVDREKCTGCMSCAAACPRGIIVPVKYASEIYVSCTSTARPKVSAKVCQNGCIACKKCEKICPTGAITVQNNLAVIDYDKCVSCGLCTAACPRRIIRDVLDLETLDEFKAKLARSTELHKRELAAEAAKKKAAAEEAAAAKASGAAPEG